MKPKHNHPIYIIKQIILMIKQSILPILAVVLANMNVEKDWVLPAGMGALFLMLIFFAIISWKNSFYYVENDVLFYQKGVLSKSKQGISISKITTINENQELIERIFKLSTFKVDAGSATKGNEIKLTITKKEAEILREQLGKINIIQEDPIGFHEVISNQTASRKTEYHISVRELILYAINSNSFFAGLIFVFTIWQFVEDIPFVKNWIEGPAGSFMNQYFESTVKGLSVPSIVTLVLFSIFVYTFFSFLISIIWAVIKYFDFTVSRQGDKIEISYGLLEKKRYHLLADKVTALYAKYGFIGQFCNMGELKIESIGYGDEKGEAAILYPILKDERRAEILSELLPEYSFEESGCRPPKRAARSFMIQYTFIPFFIAIILSFTVPYGAASWIFVVLLGVLGFVNFKKTRISRRADQFVITGGILGKQIAVIKSRHIQTIITKQSFLQKRKDLIHLEYEYQSNNLGKKLGAQFLDKKEVANMTEF